jgi:hypothetical protein
MLIARQKPDAINVAGLRTWNSLGRFVKRGEKGIFILAPTLRANISETTPVVLINEQGEEEKKRDEREFSWCCVYGGMGWRGTERRRA